MFLLTTRSEMVPLSAQTRLSSTTSISIQCSVQSVWDCWLLAAGREGGGGGGGRGGSCFGLPASLARPLLARLIFHHSSLGTANQTQTEKLEIKSHLQSPCRQPASHHQPATTSSRLRVFKKFLSILQLYCRAV